ncbi:LysR family transcriptional regulator [Vibrio campbellii]|uniref:LysR family transcriptional regulator n=1 Tax=Vibrio campbellii TaxID=680 RepID=UPI002F4281B2
MNKDLDLNLLKILVLLERHRQLKPVAKALGKSEASISKYLTRLRTQLEDELFIRHAHHFEPTHYLKRKLPEITNALDQLETCLIRREFDPLSYDRSITICLPQYPKSIHQQFIGYAPAVIVVPADLGITEVEKACELKFILLELAGWKDREQVTKRALEQSGLNIDRVATIGNITSLLKVIRMRGAATILLEYQKPIDGFNFIPVPETFYPQGRPKVVVQMKQTHRYNSMHQLLTDAIAKYVIT